MNHSTPGYENQSIAYSGSRLVASGFEPLTSGL